MSVPDAKVYLLRRNPTGRHIQVIRWTKPDAPLQYPLDEKNGLGDWVIRERRWLSVRSVDYPQADPDGAIVCHCQSSDEHLFDLTPHRNRHARDPERDEEAALLLVPVQHDRSAVGALFGDNYFCRPRDNYFCRFQPS
jgi:hypothetical protein